MPDAPALPLTGERTVPGIPEENYWFRRHEAAYEFALSLAGERSVVEIGSGEGYGTALLASVAHRVIGVDYDAGAIKHAASTYRRPQFVRANLAALPIRHRAVDFVAALQLIEHVWNHTEFVDECFRVLQPGGLAFLTTPNRLTFSPGLDVPVNPFHTKEFTAEEVASLLTSAGFEIEAVLGLHPGVRLVELDAKYGGSFVDAQLANPPVRWGRELRQDVVSVATADFAIVAADTHGVDEALDLVVLARRPIA
jgi:SAM-dependent methyltransferase